FCTTHQPHISTSKRSVSTINDSHSCVCLVVWLFVDIWCLPAPIQVLPASASSRGTAVPDTSSPRGARGGCRSHTSGIPAIIGPHMQASQGVIHHHHNNNTPTTAGRTKRTMRIS